MGREGGTRVQDEENEVAHSDYYNDPIRQACPQEGVVYETSHRDTGTA